MLSYQKHQPGTLMVGVKGLLVLGQAATGENICIWEGRHPVLTKTMKMTKTKKKKKTGCDWGKQLSYGR